MLRSSAARIYLAAIAALTLLSGAAERTSNSFFTIEGEGVRIADDGSVCVDAGASGPVKLTARSGWLVNGRESVTYPSPTGLSSGLILTSKLGEDHFCSPPPPTEEDKHDTTFVLEADATPSNMIAMYALPSTSVVVTASAESSLVEKGKHKVTTTWQEWTCPVCGAHQEGRTEVSYYDVEPDSYAWTAVAAGDMQDSNTWSGPMPKGLDQEIKFTLTAKWNPCQEHLCVTTVTATAKADVYELSIERPDYLGLDRTDAGLLGWAVTNATAHIDPEPASATYNWTKCGKCQFVSATDEQKVTYGITNSATASASFLAEDLTVTATAENSEGLSASATCTTNFTVVAVDVTIGSVGENKEEKEGAFVQHVPDTNGVISVEGTNKMVEVKFTCNPSLPENEMVTISHTGPGELYEVLASGEYSLVASGNYRAYDVSNRTFKLHGHAASTSLTNGAITIEHANSGAKDLAKYTNLGRPLLVPDYDRNGSIDEDDIAKAKAGDSVFRFWINDDNDSGDVNDSKNDRPGSGTNGSDAKVNGRGDLLDFTPVLIDVSSVFPSDATDELKARCSLQLKSSAANVVWTSLAPSESGSFHREDKGTKFGPDLSQNAHEATVTSLADWSELPVKFGELLPDFGDKGVILVEGRVAGSSLRIKVCLDDGQSIAEGELNIRVSAVEDMFRFVSLRRAADNPALSVSVPDEPSNEPNGAKNLDVFFTHGFNVSESDARAWGSEVFKRLWQAGSNAHFHILPWRGDYSWLPGDRFNGVHYPHDVWFALRTGGAFRRYVETAQPNPAKRILITQSLGNMVACEALKEGLMVGKYFMFDAALPSESIDAMLQDADAATRSKYAPGEWHAYDSRVWAANWFRLFGAGDARAGMGWPGRFADALGNAGEVYNYYSSGDDVFKEFATVPSRFDGIDVSIEMHCWQKQEVLKGSAVIAGTAYGGWGFHRWTVRELVQDIGGGTHVEERPYRYSPDDSVRMLTDGTIRDNPVFNRDFLPMLDGGASQDNQWLALAKYVPAVSSPVGGRAVNFGNTIENHDLNDDDYRDGWGRGSSDWQHSDMKDMAYFYVYKLYEQLVEKGNLK